MSFNSIQSYPARLSMPPLHGSAFKGIHNLLTDKSLRPHQEDIDDDLEGEKETLAELTHDEIAAERERTKVFSSQWRESVNEASKGVTEKTDAGYQRCFFFSFPFIVCLFVMCRLGKQCATFLIKNHLIEKPEDFFCANPPTDADMYIIAWIMNEYDKYFCDLLISSSYCDTVVMKSNSMERPSPIMCLEVAISMRRRCVHQ
jgi:hypothetical protein